MVVGDAPDAPRAFALASSRFEVVFVSGCFAQEVEGLEAFQLFGSPVDAFFSITGTYN